MFFSWTCIMYACYSSFPSDFHVSMTHLGPGGPNREPNLTWCQAGCQLVATPWGRADFTRHGNQWNGILLVTETETAKGSLLIWLASLLTYLLLMWLGQIRLHCVQTEHAWCKYQLIREMNERKKCQNCEAQRCGTKFRTWMHMVQIGQKTWKGILPYTTKRSSITSGTPKPLLFPESHVYNLFSFTGSFPLPSTSIKLFRGLINTTNHRCG